MALFGTEEYHHLIRIAAMNLLKHLWHSGPNDVQDRIHNHQLVDLDEYGCYENYIVFYCIAFL